MSFLLLTTVGPTIGLTLIGKKRRQVSLGVRLLDATPKIAVELTEGDMMDSEASVSAMVFHHP